MLPTGNRRAPDMAVNPNTRQTRPRCRLVPFRVAHARQVLAWVASPQEAYWLAPRTRPPLSTRTVLHWQEPGHQAFLLLRSKNDQPVGYGELNELTGQPNRYWLGHLIVDPAHRGHGFGVQLTRLLIERAFYRHGARDVTLVVFPENTAAIACYQTAGMHQAGFETHAFPAYGQTVQLLRMAVRAPA